MNELKAYRPRELVMQGRHNEPIYLKSEADKVIAELQSELEAKELEVASSKEDALNTDKARKQWLQLARKQANEILHNKYKRCLAMAKMCTELAEHYQAEYNAEEGFGDGWLKWIRWARKWHNRWLDIAEKFKEVR